METKRVYLISLFRQQKKINKSVNKDFSLSLFFLFRENYIPHILNMQYVTPATRMGSIKTKQVWGEAEPKPPEE